MNIYCILFYVLQGRKKCQLRNASIKEILGGVRCGDHRFDVTVQYHHVFFIGMYLCTFSEVFENLKYV